MTDQNIPADLTPEEVEAAREWATSYLNGFYKPGHVDAAARALTALLPAPPLPTLADMTDEERDACRWMQADVVNRSVRYVIATPRDGDGESTLIAPDGKIDWFFPEDVTPRPDLPRMEWPGDKESDTPDAVPPNTLAVGSEWDDEDALYRACRESGRDQIVVIDNSGGAYVWDEKAEWWEGSASPQYSPFTILHAGLEADQ